MKMDTRELAKTIAANAFVLTLPGLKELHIGIDQAAGANSHKRLQDAVDRIERSLRMRLKKEDLMPEQAAAEAAGGGTHQRAPQQAGKWM